MARIPKSPRAGEPVFSLAVSMLSFAVSATTVWLSLLHRGAIRMTKPTLVALLYQSPAGSGAR
jgi:hypothetical protein